LKAWQLFEVSSDSFLATLAADHLLHKTTISALLFPLKRLLKSRRFAVL
jgi:hypothetical protein